MSNEWTDPRPMSPHLQIWRFHLTMAASITHRVTGSALYFGSALIALWIVALSLPAQADGSAPVLYATIEGVLNSVFGQVLLVLWAAAVLFHFANGIRHLLWDGPRVGFDPKTASTWSAFNYLFAFGGAIALWAATVLI